MLITYAYEWIFDFYSSSSYYYCYYFIIIFIAEASKSEKRSGMIMVSKIYHGKFKDVERYISV